MNDGDSVLLKFYICRSKTHSAQGPNYTYLRKETQNILTETVLRAPSKLLHLIWFFIFEVMQFSSEASGDGLLS